MNIQYKAKSYSNVSASALVLLCASFAQAYAYETLETNPEVLISSSAAAPPRAASGSRTRCIERRFIATADKQ